MWKTLTEGFAIFSKYGNDNISVVEFSEFGGIFGGPKLEIMSQEDKDKLIRLGWVPDPFQNWYLDLECILND